MKHPRRQLYPGRFPRRQAVPDYRGPDAAEPTPFDVLAETLGETVVEVTQPPYLGWFPGTNDFDVFGHATLANSATAFSDIVQFRVPDAYNAILWWWGADVGAFVGWAEIQWQVRVQGRARPFLSYDRVGSFVGISQEKLCRLYVVGTAGDVFSIAGLNHSTTDDFEACARLKGWCWPAREGETL